MPIKTSNSFRYLNFELTVVFASMQIADRKRQTSSSYLVSNKPAPLDGLAQKL